MGKGPEPDNFAHTFTVHPRPSKQRKPDNKKRACRGVDSLDKICLSDGRTTYLYDGLPDHVVLWGLSPITL